MIYVLADHIAHISFIILTGYTQCCQIMVNRSSGWGIHKKIRTRTTNIGIMYTYESQWKLIYRANTVVLLTVKLNLVVQA